MAAYYCERSLTRASDFLPPRCRGSSRTCRPLAPAATWLGAGKTPSRRGCKDVAEEEASRGRFRIAPRPGRGRLWNTAVYATTNLGRPPQLRLPLQTATPRGLLRGGRGALRGAHAEQHKRRRGVGLGWPARDPRRGRADCARRRRLPGANLQDRKARWDGRLICAATMRIPRRPALFLHS